MNQTDTLLKPHQRSKLDDADDALFYDYPRFVTHVDEAFIEQLKQVYRQYLPTGGRILDLMSSWVSHLPEELVFSHVEGHGLNPEELAKNPRLDHFFVQNLNQDLQLPLADQSFDAVLIAVSVQYLQYPEAIFSEMHRVLKIGGLAIVSFSNRMFYQKAIELWRESSDNAHVQLVGAYFQATPGFSKPDAIVQSTASNPLLALFNQAQDPFFVVMARRTH